MQKEEGNICPNIKTDFLFTNEPGTCPAITPVLANSAISRQSAAPLVPLILLVVVSEKIDIGRPLDFLALGILQLVTLSMGRSLTPLVDP